MTDIRFYSFATVKIIDFICPDVQIADIWNQSDSFINPRFQLFNYPGRIHLNITDSSSISKFRVTGMMQQPFQMTCALYEGNNFQPIHLRAFNNFTPLFQIVSRTKCSRPVLPFNPILELKYDAIKAESCKIGKIFFQFFWGWNNPLEIKMYPVCRKHAFSPF